MDLTYPADADAFRSEIRAWLEENEYESVDQMRGSMSAGSAPNPGALERVNYMETLASYDMG